MSNIGTRKESVPARNHRPNLEEGYRAGKTPVLWWSDHEFRLDERAAQTAVPNSAGTLVGQGCHWTEIVTGLLTCPLTERLTDMSGPVGASAGTTALT